MKKIVINFSLIEVFSEVSDPSPPPNLRSAK